MALSLDAIFKPLNDFFLEKFKEGEASSPARFCLAAQPRSFVSSDFTGETGPSEAMALEAVSQLVDGMATLDLEAPSVRLDPANPISDFYQTRVLSPAVAFVPGDVGAEDRALIIAEFEKTKADALRAWEVNRRGMIIAGVPTGEYRPSLPTPLRWWNVADKEVWSHKAFHIDPPPPDLPAPAQSNTLVLRMRPETVSARAEARLTKIVGAERLNSFRRAPAAEVAAPVAKLGAPFARTRMRAEVTGMAIADRLKRNAPSTPVADRFVEVERPTKLDARSIIETLPIASVWAVQDALAGEAANAPVSTPGIAISFDYSVVNIDRLWLSQSLLESPYWSVPNTKQGEFSAPDGRSFFHLPVGFVAISKLDITANWTSEDLSNLSKGVDALGPFLISSEVVEGSVRHDGIQIVGWFLRQFPALPPNTDLNN